MGTHNHSQVEQLSADDKRNLLAKLLQKSVQEGNATLSLEQTKYWFFSQLEEPVPATVFSAYQLAGFLDDQRLEVCVRQLVDRHQTLRLSIPDIGGRPVRKITPNLPVKLQREDLPAGSATEQLGRIKELAQRDMQKPFAIHTAPLWRLTLVKVAPDDHILLVTMHRMIADRRSLALFIKELALLYENPAGTSPLPPLTNSFSEYVLWEREWLKSADMQEAFEYWQGQLENLPLLEMPTDRPHPAVRTHDSDWHLFEISKSLVARLENIAGQADITLPTMILAAFQLLLSRYSGQKDIAVGTPAPNRLPEKWAGLIGPCENTLVLRANLANDPPFNQLLQQVKKTQEQAHIYEKMPFEKLVSELHTQRDLSHTPLFQVRFIWNDAPAPSINLPLGQWHPIDIHPGVTRFDLTLYITKDDSKLRFGFEFNTDLFNYETIARLSIHLINLLQAVIQNPTQRISKLNFLSESECHQLTREWNSTFCKYPHHTCLHDLIEEHAALLPQKVAVKANQQELTYKDLNERANQLARYLRTLGIGPEVLVGVVAERTVDTIIALLAVLKSGGAYIPLDPKYPHSRLRFMLADSKAKVLITPNPAYADLATEDQKIVSLSTDKPKIDTQSVENLPPLAMPNNLANVIYTSGSTGKPKGVLVPHRQLVHSTHARFLTYKDPDTIPFVFMLLVSFSFDAAGVGIYWTLLQGGTLVIPADEELHDPDRLRQIIQSEKVTSFDWPPSLYPLILGEDAGPLGSLRHIEVAGEECPPHVVAKHQRILPGVRLVNNYGPTEAAIWCTTFDCRQDYQSATSVPIGLPIPNAEIYILDEHLNPVPVGVAGEIYIGGEGVTRGYLNKSGLSAERFLPNPFSRNSGGRLYKTGDLAKFLPDGNIVFLGRIDTQIKMRGYRIELREIETALNKHPSISQAIVIANPESDIPGDLRLIAYVVPKGGHSPTRHELISFLDQELPTFMVPKAYVILDEFPRTPNDKIDRNALPPPTTVSIISEDSFVAPRTTLEKEVAQIFMNVLGTDKISVISNFFDIGGNSLLLARLAARITATYEFNLPITQLFQVPTVEGISHTIEVFRRKGREGVAEAWDEAAQLDADIFLPPEITPQGLLQANFIHPQNIFLTGATGYLGAFLLEQLMKKTQANIYCLVRAANPDEGFYRIKANLQRFLIWDDSFSSRIRVIPGDLAKSMLGLTEYQFMELAAKIDAIFHSGALVNFVYPYSALKAPNVSGTQEVLRLACTIKAKAFHHISTVDVLLISHTPRPYLERDLPERPRVTLGGYPRSKWVAEKIVTIARDRGLPVCVYRPGLMMSHSKTGASHVTDYTLVGLKGFLDLGVFPTYASLLDAITIDYAAEAITHISLQADSFGKHFHLWNPNVAYMEQIYHWISSYGYEFQIEPYNNVVGRIFSVDSSHPLYPLIPLFTEESESPLDAILPEVADNIDVYQECRNTFQAIEGTNIECPPMDEAFVHRCLSFLIDTGFLAPPRTLAKASL